MIYTLRTNGALSKLKVTNIRKQM